MNFDDWLNSIDGVLAHVKIAYKHKHTYKLLNTTKMNEIINGPKCVLYKIRDGDLIGMRSIDRMVWRNMFFSIFVILIRNILPAEQISAAIKCYYSHFIPFKIFGTVDPFDLLQIQSATTNALANVQLLFLGIYATCNQQKLQIIFHFCRIVWIFLGFLCTFHSHGASLPAQRIFAYTPFFVKFYNNIAHSSC